MENVLELEILSTDECLEIKGGQGDFIVIDDLVAW